MGASAVGPRLCLDFAVLLPCQEPDRDQHPTPASSNRSSRIPSFLSPSSSTDHEPSRLHLLHGGCLARPIVRRRRRPPRPHRPDPLGATPFCRSSRSLHLPAPLLPQFHRAVLGFHFNEQQEHHSSSLTAAAHGLPRLRPPSVAKVQPAPDPAGLRQVVAAFSPRRCCSAFASCREEGAPPPHRTGPLQHPLTPPARPAQHQRLMITPKPSIAPLQAFPLHQLGQGPMVSSRQTPAV